jgi:enoyl-CoA hydratase/long-chain 3-hydroxyacyl-CoA dehydrogenase
MEAILKPHAIIATNTSAIPIGEIAKGSSRPSRIVGAPAMPRALPCSR